MEYKISAIKYKRGYLIVFLIENCA